MKSLSANARWPRERGEPLSKREGAFAERLGEKRHCATHPLNVDQIRGIEARKALQLRQFLEGSGIDVEQTNGMDAR